MLVEAENLGLILGGRTVLYGINLRLDIGEIYGLLGPNGAGKTTTISVLTGLRAASSGCVRVLGRDPALKPHILHREIGVLPERNGFYEWMTAPDYLRWFAQLYKRRLDSAAVARLLDRVGLKPARGQPIHTFSHGMRQRLGLARAVMHEPKLLILDEPTSGLDPRGRREFHDLMRQLSREQGVGILLCTHLLDDVERLCTGIGIVRRGRTRLEGNLGALLASGSASLRYRLRLADSATPGRVPVGVQIVSRQGPWWHVEISNSASVTWRELLLSDWPILEIHQERSGLEQLYLKNTEAVNTP